jgi:hypothetical protein
MGRGRNGKKGLVKNEREWKSVKTAIKVKISVVMLI